MANLSTALSTALQGMDVTQRELSLTSTNIANAGSADYTRKVAVTTPRYYGRDSAGVIVASLERQVDTYVQKQMLTQYSDLSMENVKFDALDRLETVFGTIDSDSSLQANFDAFVNSIQQLNAAPDDQSIRQNVLNEATNLAQRLNDMTEQVQFLRTEAETAMTDMVDEANLLLKELEVVDAAVKRDTMGTSQNPDALDRRDTIIRKLSEMMDIEVVPQNDGGVLLHTRGGATIFSQQRMEIEFDGAGVVNAFTEYSEVSANRSVGTVKIVTNAGSELDLLGDGLIRSGKLHAYSEMRDEILVETQNQLDHMAHYLAKALSDIRYTAEATLEGTGDYSFEINGTNFPENGTAASTPLPEGTEWTINYTVTSSANVETRHTMRLIHNSSIAAPGYDTIDNETTDPYYETITLDLTDATSIAAAFNDNRTLTEQGLNTFGTGAAGTAGNIETSATLGDVTSLFEIQDFASLAAPGVASLAITSMNMTAIGSTAVQNSDINNPVTQLPFFTLEDGTAYQGTTEELPSGDFRWQKQGFAGRISVNPALIDNLDALNVYDSTVSNPTPSGNTDRVLTMLDGLINTEYQMGPATGIGAAQSPFSGTLSLFSQQMVSRVGYMVSAQASIQISVESSYNAIEERFLEKAGVSIDQEMAVLIELEQSFAANAKIVQATDELMQIILDLVR